MTSDLFLLQFNCCLYPIAFRLFRFKLELIHSKNDLFVFALVSLLLVVEVHHFTIEI